MQNTMGMPYCLAMSVLSLMIATVILVLFPGSALVHEESETILRTLQNMVYLDRYWSRRIKAEQAVRINIGALFIVKKSTQNTFFVCIFDRTIETLLIY